MQNQPLSFVRVGPQQYRCAEGAIDELTHQLYQMKAKKILIVHGNLSWKKARPYFKSIYRSNFSIEEYQFSGECTDPTINSIKTVIEESKADVVIGVGGGKIMDTVKYAAYLANRCPFVLVPTLASNCAPWTPVSVLYHEDGSFDRLDVLPVQALLLLIEPRLIFDAPRDYFIAGMADTLAKWYESDEILSQPHLQTQPFLTMAQTAAQLCQQTILEKGGKAIEDLDQNHLTADFVAVSEVIISISGLVGGFGDDLARTTVAHEIHDALTIYPEAHHFLHGHKVGYGILVQLALEEKWDEITRLRQFYTSLAIPTSLADMKLDYLTDEDLTDIAHRASLPELPVHNLPYPVNAENLVQAIKKLESF